jgi:hypothetical protein
VTVPWEENERAEVSAALTRFPIESGKCAALARVVTRVGLARDPQTRARLITPRSAARFVVPKLPRPPIWASHTFAETHGHAVDALTAIDGCPAGEYLARHWEHVDALSVATVAPDDIDPGIQEVP